MIANELKKFNSNFNHSSIIIKVIKDNVDKCIPTYHVEYKTPLNQNKAQKQISRGNNPYEWLYTFIKLLCSNKKIFKNITIKDFTTNIPMLRLLLI